MRANRWGVGQRESRVVYLTCDDINMWIEHPHCDRASTRWARTQTMNESSKGVQISGNVQIVEVTRRIIKPSFLFSVRLEKAVQNTQFA